MAGCNDLICRRNDGTFDVYKLRFRASSSLHIHAGASATLYFVPNHSCSELKHLLFGVETIGSFGQSKLKLVTYQPSIDNAIKAIDTPEAAFNSGDATWKVLRRFKVNKLDIDNLAQRAVAANEAEQEFQSTYEQFEKQNECYRTDLFRSSSMWGWYAYIPEEPEIGKACASKGRLDSTKKFQTQEEAKNDWLRVAAENGITDFELDVVVFS